MTLFFSKICNIQVFFNYYYAFLIIDYFIQKYDLSSNPIITAIFGIGS
jgi:hypothetical protein